MRVRKPYVARSPKIYAEVLEESERKMLKSARRMEGLAEEIAVLRVLLRKTLEKSPDDVRLLSQSVDMLVKAVALQYRLSPKARKDLADHVTNLLNSLGEQLYPSKI